MRANMAKTLIVYFFIQSQIIFTSIHHDIHQFEKRLLKNGTPIKMKEDYTLVDLLPQLVKPVVIVVNPGEEESPLDIGLFLKSYNIDMNKQLVKNL